MEVSVPVAVDDPRPTNAIKLPSSGASGDGRGDGRGSRPELQVFIRNSMYAERGDEPTKRARGVTMEPFRESRLDQRD